ncbi:MAG TPA: methyltransferase domain-containing protein [Sulfurovum sp.]|nr:methyltransferase domain-containing protein [Sulfurovum sp.]
MTEKNFFENVYKNVGKDRLADIPWATLSANIYLLEYLNTQKKVEGKRALVIGCGLGDDALALEAQGYTVDAMDISPTAIALAKERHPTSKTNFYVADIFSMPKASYEAYDFVYEGLTVQSLPREEREKLISIITELVAKNGTLLVYAHTQNDKDNYGGPPWPLYAREFKLFEQNGLKKISEVKEAETKAIAPSKYCMVYKK